MSVDLKTLAPDTSLPTTGFLFGADSQAAASPSVYEASAVASAIGRLFPAGSAGAPAISRFDDLNTGIFFPAADAFAVATGGIERIRIDSQGRIAVGTTAIGGASGAFRISMPVTGAVSSSGFLNTVSVQSDVTSNARIYSSSPTTVAASFTLTNLQHYYASQGAIGAGSNITTQVGYFAESNIVGAANNYGFQGVIANATQRTITNVERTSNVVTITTSVAHGFTAGQQVTIAATTNTSLNGTFVITAVPTTTTLQYAQTAADIPSGADTGTVNSAGRYNLYMSGSAPNYMAGALSIGATTANAAAILDLTSTTRGLLLPRMTTAQRDAISSPPDGLLIYNTSLNAFQGRAGGAWVSL